MATTYTIRALRIRTGTSREQTGTIEELVKYNSYTLECGQSWEHEKGNKKINRNPKTIKSLITNLNNAENNTAKDGCGAYEYTLVSTNKS